MSLSSCLKKAGLSKHEAAILRGKVEAHEIEGHAAHAAAVRAVRSYITDLEAERDDIVRQIVDNPAARIRKQVAEARAAAVAAEKQAPQEEGDPLFSLSVDEAKKLLTEEEKGHSKDFMIKRAINVLKQLPSAVEMAAVAFAGRAKRGWYAKSALALNSIFGTDAPRFASLLAALSPQNSVEVNLENAVGVWKGWLAAGRINDPRIAGEMGKSGVTLALTGKKMDGRSYVKISDAEAKEVLGKLGFPMDAYDTARKQIKIMGESVVGSGTEDSVMDAWVRNSLIALNAENPSGTLLSGPKVNSFFRNLIGHTQEVTNDAWMANYALVDQKIFSGNLTGNINPGKRAGYLAMNMRVREAAKKLTKLTGDKWTPAEVQETIWSWAKALYELQDSVKRTARELLNDGALTESMINSVPDFGGLFNEPKYRQALADAGYGEALEELANTDQERGAQSERAPFAPETQRKHEQRAARRLEKLKEQRLAAPSIGEGGKSSPSQIRSSLVARFGEKAIRALEDQGILKIVASGDQIPSEITLDPRADGVYYRGRAYLIADRMTPDVAAAKLLHEIGEHYGLQEFLGDKGWNALAKKVRLMATKSGSEAADAWAVVKENYTEFAGMSNAELGQNARFMHEVIARLGESQAFRKTSVWQDIVTAIKTWLAKHGFTGAITEEDVGRIIEGSLKYAARAAEARQERIVDDLEAQTAYLSREALKRGYKDIDEFIQMDMPGFVSIAEQWRVEHEMESQRTPVFYSELARQLDRAPMKAAPAKAWTDYIKSLKGVKADEVAWTGIEDWLKLQGAKVPKERVSAYLRDNGVKVEEVTLGAFDHWAVYDGSDEQYFDTKQEAEDYARKYGIEVNEDNIFQKHGSEFSNWQLPGGENYRELLLVLPEVIPAQSNNSKSAATTAFERDMINKYGGESFPGVYNLLSPAEVDRYEMRVREDRNSNKTANARAYRKENFKSSHFEGYPNILAHVRFNERTDADGKRVLFIEEIQSDWAQKGKKEGFSGTEDRQSERDRRIAEAQARGATPGELRAIEQEVAKKADAVPTAPFVTKTEAWVALALKRMIRYAAEHGFDRVAWTTGEQQAERYDLSKQVRAIAWTGGNAKASEKIVTINPINGNDIEFRVNKDGIVDSVYRQTEFEGKRLSDVVGKEIADRIMAEPANIISGEGLRIGGRGMIEFYNRIVPNVANDVLKKLSGGRVGEVDIEANRDAWKAWDKHGDPLTYRDDTEASIYFPSESAARKAAKEYSGTWSHAIRKTSEQQGFDITPELRAKALQGLPLFSIGLGDLKQKAGGQWQSTASNWLQDLIRKMQDKHVDTKEVLNAIKATGKKVADELDVYLQEELFHGRAAKAVKDFLAHEMKPLVEEMALRKVSIDELDEYLHARHAEERNVAIAKINPGLPDGGSGMNTKDARAYIAKLDPAKKKVLDSLASKVDQINAGTRKLLVQKGLESASTIRAWESAYKHYVPLQREDMQDYFGTGQGFSVRGGFSRRATGSNRSVVDILANVAMQRERAITLGEKAVIANALVGLAKLNPRSDFWRVDKPPKVKIVNDQTGLVEERVDPQYKSRPNVVVARAPNAMGEIEEHVVVFSRHNERAMNMAMALKNLDIDDMGQVLSAAAKVTRWFAAVNTQYNPVFGAINLIRDTGAAAVNLSSTLLAGKQKAVLGNIHSALSGIYSDIRAERAGGKASSQWSQLYEEFQKEGGQTGYRDMFRTSNARADDIQSEINRVTEGKATALGRAVFDWLSDYNEAMENAVRLSSYKVAMDNGMSKQRAASLAKNLTVNFNRKGQIGTQVGALYAFFNASVQGTARMAETLNGPMGKKIIYGGLLLGASQAMLMTAAGFDDDEPSEFVKERNLIIPIGGNKYFAIPLPLGLHIIPNIGRVLTEWALNDFKKTGERMTNLLGSFIDAFNPIGNAGWSLQTISPTIADPLVALAENKDWTGKTIYKPDYNALAPTPGYTRAKDTASWFGKVVSKSLNYMSGGTAYNPGYFSPTADQIDYLVGQVTGGVGREALKLQQTVASAVTGEDLPTHKIPLVGRLYGDVSSQSSQSGRYYENLKLLNAHENEIKGRAKDGVKYLDYMKENPESKLVPLANDTERVVSELRRRKRMLVEQGAPKEKIRPLELAISLRMTMLNNAVKAAQSGAPYKSQSGSGARSTGGAGSASSARQ